MASPSVVSITKYQGSVKDVQGPVALVVQGERLDGMVFSYTDAYSVFDWGRMPDKLPRKGEALCVLAACLFEKLERPETWQEFSRSETALALRKACRFGTRFNELGERLKKEGLRTHYFGLVSGPDERVADSSGTKEPTNALFVSEVDVTRPEAASVLGRTVFDYYSTCVAGPRLVPLEVVFRFACPPGSSLIERAKQEGYLASIGFPEVEVSPGVRWDFPVLEIFTKLETSDRLVSLGEGLAISCIQAGQLDELLLKTAWVAGCLKWICEGAGIELADGKFEWGIDDAGETILVDAIGPDELRLLKNDVQLSKEFLRNHYRDTDWYRQVVDAKKKAEARGTAEWKKLVAEGPPPLPAAKRELATHLYLSLANALSGREWFKDAWPLDRVVAELGRIK